VDLSANTVVLSNQYRLNRVIIVIKISV